MKREETRAIQVGNLTLGGKNHVIIQSMTNTKTKNVEATVKQIQELEDAGCEMVRMAVFDKEDAYAIADIKKQVHIPLVADIHFDYRLALIAIESGIDKIRINPGNIGSIEKVKAVVESCKEHHIPIRIGVNSGSLEKDILEKYGRPTAKGMIESAKKHIDILESLDFHDYCISLKSSDTMLTIAKTLLKELGLIKNVPTLVSCPTCGRIQYDLIPVAKEIEDFLNNIHQDITVAIMGCAVNGPGEAKNADIGIAGGVKEGLLIKKGKIIKKVKQEDMVQTLKDEILKMVNS